MDLPDAAKSESARVHHQHYEKIDECRHPWRTTLGRKSKLIFAVLSMVALSWYHYDFLQDIERSRSLPIDIRNASSTEFDWFTVCHIR